MASYSLKTKKGVGNLLQDIHKIRASAYDRSDYGAIDILVDLKRAIKQANLTDRQREALYYIYIRGVTQQEAAHKMGLKTGKTVFHYKDTALQKIAEVYDSWDYS